MAKNYIDIKISVWNRAHFNDDADMNKVAEMLRNGCTSGEICNEDNNLGYSGEWETLLDSESPLKVEENDGIATIEVYSDGEPIFVNGKTLYEEHKKETGIN